MWFVLYGFCVCDVLFLVTKFSFSDVLFGLEIQFQWCSSLDYGCPTALFLPFKEDNIPIEIATIRRCCVSDHIIVGLTPTYAVLLSISNL